MSGLREHAHPEVVEPGPLGGGEFSDEEVVTGELGEGIPLGADGKPGLEELALGREERDEVGVPGIGLLGSVARDLSLSLDREAVDQRRRLVAPGPDRCRGREYREGRGAGGGGVSPVHAEGPESPGLEQNFAGLAARQVERLGTSPSGEGPAMLDYGRVGLTGLSYGTGALMFYALYRTLGEATFDRALAHWFEKYRASGSTSEQFMTAMAAAAGRELTELFTDWLTTAGWYERLSAGESLEDLIDGTAAGGPLHRSVCRTPAVRPNCPG